MQRCSKCGGRAGTHEEHCPLCQASTPHSPVAPDGPRTERQESARPRTYAPAGTAGVVGCISGMVGCALFGFMLVNPFWDARSGSLFPGDYAALFAVLAVGSPLAGLFGAFFLPLVTHVLHRIDRSFRISVGMPDPDAPPRQSGGLIPVIPDEKLEFKSGLSQKAAAWGLRIGLGLPPTIGFGLTAGGWALSFWPGKAGEARTLMNLGSGTLCIIPFAGPFLAAALGATAFALEAAHKTATYMRDPTLRQTYRRINDFEEDELDDPLETNELVAGEDVGRTEPDSVEPPAQRDEHIKAKGDIRDSRPQPPDR